MIEIKNVTQIGTPKEESKIYVENLAYRRMRAEDGREKRVYVLMGRTQRMDGAYATFVEAAIPISEMEFTGNLPQWNNLIWAHVFKRIKEWYEEKIIVGWALDLRGMPPKLTVELERIHRENFGGMHQVLLLMDSLEREEVFYIYEENHLAPKDGFFIYYHTADGACLTPEAEMEMGDSKSEYASGSAGRSPQLPHPYRDESVRAEGSNLEVHVDATETVSYHRGRYRQMLTEAEKPKETLNGGLAIAVVLLVLLIVVGAYGGGAIATGGGVGGAESSDTASGETAVGGDAEDTEISDATPGDSAAGGTVQDKENTGTENADAPSGGTISIEVVPGS